MEKKVTCPSCHSADKVIVGYESKDLLYISCEACNEFFRVKKGKPDTFIETTKAEYEDSCGFPPPYECPVCGEAQGYKRGVNYKTLCYAHCLSCGEYYKITKGKTPKAEIIEKDAYKDYELLPAPKKCPNCGSQDRFIVGINDHGKYRAKCEACGKYLLVKKGIDDDVTHLTKDDYLTDTTILNKTAPKQSSEGHLKPTTALAITALIIAAIAISCIAMSCSKGDQTVSSSTSSSSISSSSSSSHSGSSSKKSSSSSSSKREEIGSYYDEKTGNMLFFYSDGTQEYTDGKGHALRVDKDGVVDEYTIDSGKTWKKYTE